LAHCRDAAARHHPRHASSGRACVAGLLWGPAGFRRLRASEVLHPVSKNGLSVTDFGTREFATLDCDGNLLTFYQSADHRTGQRHVGEDAGLPPSEVVRTGAVADGRELAAAFVERLERRDWDGLGELLHPGVVYEIAQSRERIRGRDRYIQFNADGWITKVTDFWPEPYEPPAGREHLVERW